jgi:hypothetical protein
VKIIQNNVHVSVGDVKQLAKYMQDLVVNAKGNVVSFTLRQAKRALGAESKSEEAALRAALEALVGLGLLQKAPGRKPRYLLRRGTPLWSALERGCTDLPAALADGRPPQPPARRGRPAEHAARQTETPASRRGGGAPTPGPAGFTSPGEKRLNAD